MVSNILYNPYISGHFFVEPIQSLAESIVQESAALQASIQAMLVKDQDSGTLIGIEINSISEFLLRVVELVRDVVLTFFGAPVLATMFVVGCIVKASFFYLGASYNLSLLKMSECTSECYPELVRIVSAWHKLGYSNNDVFAVTPKFDERVAGWKNTPHALNASRDEATSPLICRDESDNIRAVVCRRDESVAFKDKNQRNDYIKITHIVTHPKNCCSTYGEDTSQFALLSAIFLIRSLARECLKKNKAGIYVEAAQHSKHAYEVLGFEKIPENSIISDSSGIPMLLSYKSAAKFVFTCDLDDVARKRLKEGDLEWDTLWLNIASSPLSWDEIRDILQTLKNTHAANAELITSIEACDSWLTSLVSLDEAMQSDKIAKIVVANQAATPLQAQVVLTRHSGYSARAQLLCSLFSLLKLKNKLENLPETEGASGKRIEAEHLIFGKQAACFSKIRAAISVMSQNNIYKAAGHFIKADPAATPLLELITPSVQYDLDAEHYQRKVVPLNIPEAPAGVEIDGLIEWYHETMPTMPFKQLETWFEDDYQIKRMKESKKNKICSDRLEMGQEPLPAEALQLLIERECRTYICNRLYLDLERYIDRVKTRQAYTATPPAGTAALELFYKNIENAVKHVIKKINDMEHGERSLSTRTHVLVDYLRAAGHCGPRILSVAIKNYREVVQEVPQTFENIIYQKLDDVRDKIIETALAPKGGESVMYYNRAVYALGKELGIPGFELVLSAGPLLFMFSIGGKFDEQRDRVRFFGRYTPQFIQEWIALDINQDLELRDKCESWFKERVPVDWTSEDVTRALASTATMKRENRSFDEIRKALLDFDIQVNVGQTPEEAIEDRRREDFLTAEVREVVDDRPRIKREFIYKMLVELRVLQKVSEMAFLRT